MPQLEIIVRTTFIALHCWPDAISEVDYLKHPHRHTFHVEAIAPVTHENRDVEFILLKQRVDRWIAAQIDNKFDGRTHNWSCERWAREIAEAFGFKQVSVFEDNENGARYTA